MALQKPLSINTNDLGKITAIHVLHHTPELPAHNVTFNVVDNVLVRRLLHDSDLRRDSGDLIDAFGQHHLLNRHFLIGPAVRRNGNGSARPTSDLYFICEPLCGVLKGYQVL